MHRDIVHEVPEGCINLGYSGPCAIQGLYIPNRLLTVQAHPEFNEFIMSHLVEARHDSGLFNEELAKDGAARAGNHHDGALVAKKIIEFITSSVV
jgi:GMP synthase - Glutamine amidotransferase domain